MTTCIWYTYLFFLLLTCMIQQSPNSSLQRPDNSTDDVYNHLNEPAQIEISDNYEHARPPNAAENGYGMLTIERMSNDYYCAVDVASSSDSVKSWGEQPLLYITTTGGLAFLSLCTLLIFYLCLKKNISFLSWKGSNNLYGWECTNIFL